MERLVSIIVPNYNHASFLEQRLDSIFNQTYQNFEVILLDDHSSDDSVAILTSYSNHLKVSHLEVNEVNSGSPFKQWQKGIELAKGDIIWIAESDDFCSADLVQECITMFDRFETIGVTYVQSEDVDIHGNVLSNRITYTQDFADNIWEKAFQMEGSKFIENYLSKKNVIPNASAVLFKKEYLDLSIFEPIVSMNMCGDWLFWLHLLQDSNIAFSNKTCNAFRKHAATSRMHTTLEKKKRRLIEEMEVRDYLYQHHSLHQRQSIKLVLQKWYVLHSISDLFKKKFYKILPSGHHSLIIALKFISFKIRKRFKF